MLHVSVRLLEIYICLCESYTVTSKYSDNFIWQDITRSLNRCHTVYHNILLFLFYTRNKATPFTFNDLINTTKCIKRINGRNVHGTLKWTVFKVNYSLVAMTMDEDIEVLDVTLEEDEYDLARRRMRELYRMSFVLLSRPERLILYKILKDYRFRRDLIRLVLGLNVLIRTQSKIELLKHIRYFVWEGHIKDFDRYTKFHEKFRPRKPRDLHNRSATSSRYSPVPSRSSRISAHNTRHLAKTKTHFSNTLTVPSRGRLTCSINVKAIYLIM